MAETYNDGDFYKKLKQYKSYYPNLITDFISFIIQYSSTEVVDKLKESKIHIEFDEKIMKMKKSIIHCLQKIVFSCNNRFYIWNDRSIRSENI